MSKPVRLPDYLHAELTRLAKEEKRSLANMVQVLLEQALKMDSASAARSAKAPALGGQAGMTPQASALESADAQPRDIPSRTVKPSAPAATSGAEDYFKPDPKKPEKPKRTGFRKS